MGRWWVWWLLALSGCASSISEQTFFGRSLEQPLVVAPPVSTTPAPSAGRPLAAGQGGDALIGQGAVIYRTDGPRISLRFANHGSRPVRLSYVTDEYVAKTAQGRTEVLEKDDFLTYPDVLKPGEEQPVTLHAPTTFPLTDIASLIATLHNGQARLSLQSIVPHPPRTWPPGGVSVGQPRVLPSASNVIPIERAPIVPELTQEPELVGPPIGTVPVEVEFIQELGQALSLEVQWDETAAAQTLHSRDRQLFYVVPGHHELRVRCRLSGVSDTTALVPLDVGVGQPLRVAVSATARFSGADVTVRVWQGERLLIERVVAPGAAG